MFTSVAVLWATAASTLLGTPDPTAAVRAADFLNSRGAVSAVSVRGENLARTIECVRYLGLRWIRSGYESDVPVADLIELHRQTGVRFSYGLLSGGTDIPRLLKGARQLAAAGALLALEGNNEPNNWGITYQGEAGSRNLSWLPVAKLQIPRTVIIFHFRRSGTEGSVSGIAFPDAGLACRPDTSRWLA